MQLDRSSNVELLRVVAIISVVAFHYFCFADPQWQIERNLHSAWGWLQLTSGVWGKVAINCFVIISSWFLCTRTISLGRLIKLALPVFFYKLLIGAACNVLGIEWKWDWGIFDFAGSHFVGAFLAFVLLIPVLNQILGELSKRVHALLAILVILYSALVTLGLVGDSYSCNYVVWFACLFVFVSYLRHYPAQWQTRFHLHVICTMALYSLCVFSVLGMSYFERFIHHHSPLWFLIDANKLPAMMLSISLFFLFLNLPIGHCRRINAVAATTFGVLLMHAGVLAQPIWIGVFHVERHRDMPAGILLAVFSIVCVYGLGVVAEFLRQRLIDIPLLDWLKRKGIVR